MGRDGPDAFLLDVVGSAPPGLVALLVLPGVPGLVCSRLGPDPAVPRDPDLALALLGLLGLLGAGSSGGSLGPVGLPGLVCRDWSAKRQVEVSIQFRKVFTFRIKTVLPHAHECLIN